MKRAESNYMSLMRFMGRNFCGATYLAVDNTSASVTEQLEVNAIKFDPVQDKDVIRTVSGSYTVAKTPQSFSFDADGNQLTMYDDQGRLWNLTWNAENRMTAAEAATCRIEFNYDYQGRRFSKKVYTGAPGDWTLASEQKFVYDGYYQIAEFDGNNTLKKSYLRNGDELLAATDATQNATCFFIIDGNKNVRAMVDASGSVVAEYCYNPFGKVITQTGACANTNKYRFSSEFHDDETGLVYYNYRYYSPSLQRWLNRDPIEEQGGDNLYAFVNNNPVGNIDALGLDFIAVADRRVDNTAGLYHYSLQKWECCASFKPLNHSSGFTPAEIRKKCRGNGRDSGPARKKESVELLADEGWTAWRDVPLVNVIGGIGSRTWTRTPVNIAVIRYSDRATKTMPICDGNPTVIEAKWQQIVNNAQNYPWAEQYDFKGRFKHWPNSLYPDWVSWHDSKNNSNTFVRNMVTQAGLSMVEMSGSHPGRYQPSSGANDPSYTFSASYPPWRTGTPAPPRPPATDY